MKIPAALMVALAVLLSTHSQGDQNMCTGAEPAAAKAVSDVAMAAAAEEAATGAAMTALASGAEALPAAIAASDAVYAGATMASAAAASGTGGGTAGSTPSLSTLATGASAANAGLGILQALEGRNLPRTPKVAGPTIMPAPDDEATRRARAAKVSALSQRRGRASTILSNDTLGGY